jgi:hypothetical protein
MDCWGWTALCNEGNVFFDGLHIYDREQWFVREQSPSFFFASWCQRYRTKSCIFFFNMQSLTNRYFGNIILKAFVGNQFIPILVPVPQNHRFIWLEVVETLFLDSEFVSRNQIGNWLVVILERYIYSRQHYYSRYFWFTAYVIPKCKKIPNTMTTSHTNWCPSFTFVTLA